MSRRRWTSAVRGAAVMTLITAFLVTVAGCGPSRSTKGSATTPTRPVSTPTSALEPIRHGRTLQSVGEPRRVPERFFGFNGASIVQSVNVERMLDPELQNRLAEFPTRLIRVPSGTAAQWIDWRTGRFINAQTSPFARIPADRRPVTMEDWAELLHRTKAEPVWDLNVLNSTLDDQIEMLEEAKRLGLPVTFVELGNELWDPRGTYPQRFPSGVDYAREMNDWIPVLRRRFPGVRIAVSGADMAEETFTATLGPRYNDWNTEVLSTIRGADAIAIHPYWGLPGHAPPGSDVNATLTAGLDHWRRVTDLTLASIPDGMEVWLTEWNQAAHFVSTGTQIWAQALSVIAVGIEQMTDPRVKMSLVHNIVDGTGNPHDIGVSTVFPSFTNGEGGTPVLARTALGHTLPLLFSVVGPDSTAQRVTVEGVTGTGDHPGIVGVVISGGHAGALLVNMTSEAFTVQLPPGVARSLGSKAKLTTVSAPPDSSPGWIQGDEAAESTSRIGATAGVVELAPYSVVRIAEG